MTKGPSGFEGTVRVPWAAKVAYKFVVDGRWATTDQAATERDSIGNLNNVYYAPTKPEIPTIINELPMVTVVPPHRAQVKNLELSLPVEETESRENGTPVVPLFQQQIPLPQPTQEIPPQSEVFLFHSMILMCLHNLSTACARTHHSGVGNTCSCRA